MAPVRYDESVRAVWPYDNWPWCPPTYPLPQTYPITTTGTRMTLYSDDQAEEIHEMRQRIERLEELLLKQVEVNGELFKMLMEQIARS